jgi:hypothetical protein
MFSSPSPQLIFIPVFSAEADRLCDGVPRQLKQLKRSRREALAWYREQYYLGDGEGVQKLVEA